MLIGSLRLHKAVHYHAHTGLPIPLQHTAQLERNKLGSTWADGLAASGTAFCSTAVSDLKVTALPHTTTTPEKAALSAVYWEQELKSQWSETSERSVSQDRHRCW